MPIYVYHCRFCDLTLELRRGIEARKLSPTCEGCGATMKLMPTAPATVIFRGSGFFSNDYGKSK